MGETGIHQCYYTYTYVIKNLLSCTTTIDLLLCNQYIELRLLYLIPHLVLKGENENDINIVIYLNIDRTHHHKVYK